MGIRMVFEVVPDSNVRSINRVVNSAYNIVNPGIVIALKNVQTVPNTIKNKSHAVA